MSKEVLWADIICPKCGSSWVIKQVKMIGGLTRVTKDELYFCLDCKQKWVSKG